MTLPKIVLSHKSDEYITPESLYKTLNETFNFKLDPATTDDNPLRTEFFYTKENDGLNTFINPPYSKTKLWVRKAYDQINCKSNPQLAIVMLVASRTDTKWFHQIVLPAEKAGKCFLPGRIKFRGLPNSAPFPSVILIFQDQKTKEQWK